MTETKNNTQAPCLRDIEPKDYPAILALNQVEEVRSTAPMDEALLREILASCAYAKVLELDGTVEGFLLALPEGGDYDCTNYHYFSRTFPHFLYIDRIVLSPHTQGRDLGGCFYRDLFQYAKAQGFPTVCAEINCDPPNYHSLHFHAKHGFSEIARMFPQPFGRKMVSLQHSMP